jgi:hypothetical protein
MDSTPSCLIIDDFDGLIDLVYDAPTQQTQMESRSLEQLSHSAWKIAEQFGNSPFAAGAKEAAADYMRQAHVTFDALSKVATGSISDGQRLMSEHQRRGEVVLHRISEHARANVEAAFDACAAVVRARSVPEVAQIQTRFMQDQFTAFLRQSQELATIAFSSARLSGRNGKEE